jgi:ABC-type multidrug transport system ATPase subunit
VQDLAAGGRSIATTIHQPSSRLYQKLDWLMLLAEGHLMYYGKADQVCYVMCYKCYMTGHML